MERTTTFHVELMSPLSEEDLARIITGAGIQTLTVRATTQNVDGVIITDTLIEGIWNHETGQDACTGECQASARPHLPYRQLDQRQRSIFAQRVAAFMDESRFQAFEPINALAEDEEFDNIALRNCRR